MRLPDGPSFPLDLTDRDPLSESEARRLQAALVEADAAAEEASRPDAPLPVLDFPAWLDEQPPAPPEPAAPVPRPARPPKPPRRPGAPVTDRAERPAPGTARAARPGRSTPPSEGPVEAPAFALTVYTGGGPVIRRSFPDRVVRVGRGRDCDLRLDAPTISRRHAEIERVWQSGWVLRDLRSSNGVRVNGQRVEVWHLKDGDVIGIGKFALVFSTTQGGVSPARSGRVGESSVSAGAPIPEGWAEPARPAGPEPAAPAPRRRRAAPQPVAQAFGPAAAPPPPHPPALAGLPEGADPAGTILPEGGERGDPAAATLLPGGAAPSDDGPETIYGQTIHLAFTKQAADHRERSVRLRAYLRGLDDPRKGGVRVCRSVLERDVFLIGGGEDADLRLPGWCTPRVCAVIVRGLEGYSVHAVAAWPFAPRLNGRAVADREWLEHGDELAVAGRRFVFEAAEAS